MLTNMWYPAGTEHRRRGQEELGWWVRKGVWLNQLSQTLHLKCFMETKNLKKERKENEKIKFHQVSQPFKPGHRNSVQFLGLYLSFTSCVEIHWNSQTGPGVPGAAPWVTSLPCSDGFPLSSWAREVPPVLQNEGGGKGNERDGNRRAKTGQAGDGRIWASPVPSQVCFGTAQPRGGKNEKEHFKKRKKH